MAKKIYRSYSEIISGFYHDIAACRNITFQITDDCCLNCSYCYQINKGHKKMTKETAKQAVDLLFKMYDDDVENAFINKNTHGIILDFIGGEPFMNVPIMDFIIEYFIDKCIETDHEWLINFRASLATNGMLYFEPEVQDFIKKYNDFLSLTVSIDGPKEIHDSCRVDYDGKGSFDRAYAAMKHYQTHYNPYMNDNTKVTIAPENLINFNTIVDFFSEGGIEIILANPVYEAKWNQEHARIYYRELIRLADKMLADDNIKCSRFYERNYHPHLISDNQNWCGGDGHMLAFNPDGIAYPCLRYMESSLGDSRPPLIIGNVKDGIYNTEETLTIKQELTSITRRSQSTDECFHCPIAAGCAWCSAWNYQENGSVHKRSTNICWMHRAESIANVYYWNMKYRQENIQKRFPFYLEQKYALEIISEDEYDTLLRLSMWEW
jgi:radical SAM peptide maturase (CXXX-repeat target family)